MFDGIVKSFIEFMKKKVNFGHLNNIYISMIQLPDILYRLLNFITLTIRIILNTSSAGIK